jgi:hypothetical protein
MGAIADMEPCVAAENLFIQWRHYFRYRAAPVKELKNGQRIIK